MELLTRTEAPERFVASDRERPARNSGGWAHLVVYGFMAIVVLTIGGVAIWSFVQRQALVVQPESLPKVTIVTADPNSKLAASWVRLLGGSELSPTLVPLETFNPIEGVVIFCDIDTLPPRLAEVMAEFVRRGGAVAFVGRPPSNAIGDIRLISDEGESGEGLQLSESASPLLARLDPGRILKSENANVAFLKESPRMVVDARWQKSARAAVMHMEVDGSRVIWLGIDPATIDANDRQLRLLLKSTLRWVAGQPVSDGAVGEAEVARALSPAARRDARSERFAFSVDRTRDDEVLTVRMTNRGGATISNPCVKIWLPPGVTEVELGGDMIMKRRATLTGAPSEGACLVTLPSLARNEDRVLKLRVKRPPERVASR
jgi:hypothetical protein